MKEIDTRTKLIPAYEKPMEEQQFTQVRTLKNGILIQTYFTTYVLRLITIYIKWGVGVRYNSFFFSFFFYFSMHRDVPKKALEEGLEPVKVKGDGNCLFRSISKIITENEDDHLLFRLTTVKQGCLNKQYRNAGGETFC